MFSRRKFLKSGALLAAMSLLPAGFACRQTTKSKKIGIQLWTLHQDLDQDFDATIRAVTGIGYKRLEGYGYKDGLFYNKTPRDLKAYLNDLDARMTSVHTDIPWNEGDADWDYCKKAVADAAELGSQWLIQPYYQIERELGIDGVKRLADHYNCCGEIAKSFGLKFGYHNLTMEFDALDGEIPYEVLLNYTNPEYVSFQIDTVQLVTAGYVCHEYVQRFPGRFGTWHIKDTPAGRKGDSCDLGKGVVDFNGIFEYASVAGMEDFYVEQEDFDRSRLDCIQYDYDFLMEHFPEFLKTL